MGTDMFYLNQRYMKQDFYYSELLHSICTSGWKGWQVSGRLLSFCIFNLSHFRDSLCAVGVKAILENMYTQHYSCWSIFLVWIQKECLFVSGWWKEVFLKCNTLCVCVCRVKVKQEPILSDVWWGFFCCTATEQHATVSTPQQNKHWWTCIHSVTVVHKISKKCTL